MKLKLVNFLPLLVTVMLLGFTSCNSHVVKTDTLNVRAPPSKNGKVIGQLHRRDRIDVTPYNEKWGEIEFEEKKGYVASEYLCTTKEHFIGTLKTIGIIAGILMFFVGGGLAMSIFGGGSSSSSKSRAISSSKTKSDYAREIAIAEQEMGDYKQSLVIAKNNEKNFPGSNAQNIVNLKYRIEQKKAYIASLKAQMKAAPKG